MKFDIFNEFEVIAFTKVLILNEIEYQVTVVYDSVEIEDLSSATSTHYIVEIISKV